MKLELNDAYVKYGENYALKNFTYEFTEGKIYCILGENGCGKTTLVKSLVSKYADSKEVSYVAQEMNGNINLTTLDVVSLGRYNPNKFFNGLSLDDREFVDRAIKEMELDSFKDRIVDTLSGGEKQRVMVARALAQNTSWIILDEPSSNLDVRHTESMLKKLKSLKENDNKSIIIVLHDINLASRYADEILLMKKGELLESTGKLTKELLKKTFNTEFEEFQAEDKRSIFSPI